VAPPPIANIATPARAVSHAPFAIQNQLVAEDGHIVSTIARASHYDDAVPIGGDRYRIHGMVVDAATGTVARDLEPASFRVVDSTQDDYALDRFTEAGALAWSKPLRGVRSVRPPDLVVGGARVVVTLDSHVFAFDDRSGKSAWTARNEGGDHLSIHGDTVYYVDCLGRDHWLVGRALADGARRFRTDLPVDCDLSLRVDDHHAIVVGDRGPMTIVFDLAGHELYRLAEATAGDLVAPWGAIHTVGPLSIVVTDKHISGIGDDGHVHWQLPPPENTFVAADAFVDLDGGDVVIANYGAIDDSGVDVFRLAPQTGHVVWHARVPSLGVGHSEYMQMVYARARGSDLFVISQAAGGWILERLALATGARDMRCTAMGCSRVM
jgi:outer membrane protein assembly factor BamB